MNKDITASEFFLTSISFSLRFYIGGQPYEYVKMYTYFCICVSNPNRMKSRGGTGYAQGEN